MEPLLTPHFGLTLTPHPALSLALTAHLASANPTTGASAVQFWTYPYPDDTHAVVQRFRFDYAALPLRLAAGARWASPTLAPLRWSVAATARYTRWSAWPDRHGEPPNPAFSDTLARNNFV